MSEESVLALDGHPIAGRDSIARTGLLIIGAAMRRFVVVLAVGSLLVLALAEIFFRFLPVTERPEREAVNADNPVMKFKPNTGFTYSYGWTLARPNKGRVNNDGFLNDQDYDPADTRPLLAIIGDCFIEAEAVPARETVQGRLAAKVGTAGRVYSFAASDAPLSQYLIWAEYAAHKYRASGLVISIVFDDFAESLRGYEDLPGRHYFFNAPGDRLELRRVDFVQDLLTSVARRSALARYLHHNVDRQGLIESVMPTREQASVAESSSDSIRQQLADSEKVIPLFLDELPRRTALPPDRILLVVESVRPEVYTGESPEEDKYFGVLRARLLEAAQQRGYETVDLHPRFASEYRRNKQLLHFAEERHWNSAGHAVVADATAESAVFSKVFSRGLGPESAAVKQKQD